LGPSGGRPSIGRSTEWRSSGKAEEYRKFRAKQKAEIVLAGLRGEVSIKEVCREHEIAETLYYSWREKLLEGGQTARWQGRTQQREGATAQDRQLERALGRKTYELEILGNGFRTWE
jgi:transposase-like protein